MFELETVNEVVVRPLPTDTIKDIRRSTIIKEPNALILLASKKKSGKTTCIAEVCRNLICHYPLELIPKISIIQGNGGVMTLNDIPEESDDADKYERKLTFIIFSGTIHNDIRWKAILDMMAKSASKVMIEDSTYDVDGRNLVELLITRLKRLNSEDYEEPLDPLEADIDRLMTPIEGNGDFCVIIDDLASQLKKNKSIDILIKNMRHYRIKHLIISSQGAKDFTRDQFDNADNVILFKKLQPDRLKHIYDCNVLDLSFDKFIKVYQQATKKDHSFLMIDKNTDKYYNNFNQRFKL
jgi:hypothetical protein